MKNVIGNLIGIAWAAICGAAQSWTRLKPLSNSSSIESVDWLSTVILKIWFFQSTNMVYLSICLCHLQFLSSTSYSFLSTNLLPPSVQSLSCVQLFTTPWTAARQASLSITHSWSLSKLMSIKLVMPSNHLILFACLGRFISGYFILFYVMVSDIVCLISLFDFSLLVCRNATDFNVWILYPVTLLNLLMSSSGFLVALLRFSLYSIMSSANSSTSSFPLWIPFSSFFPSGLLRGLLKFLGLLKLCWIKVVRVGTQLSLLVL